MWTKTVDKIAKTEQGALTIAFLKQFRAEPQAGTWYCDCGESLALYFNKSDGDTLTIGICEACCEHEHT